MYFNFDIFKRAENPNCNVLSWLSMTGIAMEHFHWTKENRVYASREQHVRISNLFSSVEFSHH